MAGVQSSVSTQAAAGVPGQEYDCESMDIQTRIATVAIPFGALVTITAENVALPVVTTDVTATLIGIALLDPDKPSGGSANTTGGYAIGDPVRVMRKGRCWVTPEEGTAVAGFQPFGRFTASGGNVVGGIRSDADTAKAVAIPHAHYLTTVFGTVAVLELGLP